MGEVQSSLRVLLGSSSSGGYIEYASGKPATSESVVKFSALKVPAGKASSAYRSALSSGLCDLLVASLAVGGTQDENVISGQISWRWSSSRLRISSRLAMQSSFVLEQGKVVGTRIRCPCGGTPFCSGLIPHCRSNNACFSNATFTSLT